MNGFWPAWGRADNSLGPTGGCKRLADSREYFILARSNGSIKRPETRLQSHLDSSDSFLWSHCGRSEYTTQDKAVELTGRDRPDPELQRQVRRHDASLETDAERIATC